MSATIHDLGKARTAATAAVKAERTKRRLKLLGSAASGLRWAGRAVVFVARVFLHTVMLAIRRPTKALLTFACLALLIAAVVFMVGMHDLAHRLVISGACFAGSVAAALLRWSWDGILRAIEPGPAQFGQASPSEAVVGN